MLVDFQDEFVAGRLPLPRPEARGAIQRAQDLADWARHVGILVVLVKNISARPKSPLFAADSKTSELVAGLRPHAEDLVLQKSLASAFTQTSFDADLHARHIDTLIIGGFMTHLAGRDHRHGRDHARLPGGGGCRRYRDARAAGGGGRAGRSTRYLYRRPRSTRWLTASPT